MSPRQLHLNVNLLHSGVYPSAWRLPDSDPRAFFDLGHYVRVAQIAERGKFDAIFLADSPAVNDRIDYRSFTSMEPTIVLATVAATTRHVGLIGTVSTTYNEPYNIARRFVTLDHASGGRGWNAVTTADAASGRNFGLSSVTEHKARYERAKEFTEVVHALFDSWEDDAFVGDKASARFVDTSKVHPIAHRGPHYSVAGPLNVPRSPQGRPVTVQAGGSNDGRDFAAAYAEAVFTLAQSIEEGVAYARDLRARATCYRRAGNSIVILPGLATVIGSTEAEAKRRQDELWELVPIEYSLARLAGTLQIDPSPARARQAPAGSPAASGQRQPHHVPRHGEYRPPRQSHSPPTDPRARRRRRTSHHRRHAGADRRRHRGLVQGGRRRRFQPDARRTAVGSGDFRRYRRAHPAEAAGCSGTEYAGTTLREHFGLPRPVSRYAKRSPEVASA